MIIWKNKYAYFGTNGSAIGYDANGQFEIVVDMTSVDVNERHATAVPKTKQNEQRMQDAISIFGIFIGSPQAQNMQVGEEASLTSDAKIKKLPCSLPTNSKSTT